MVAYCYPGDHRFEFTSPLSNYLHARSLGYTPTELEAMLGVTSFDHA